MAFVSNARFTLRCMISSGLFLYMYIIFAFPRKFTDFTEFHLA